MATYITLRRNVPEGIAPREGEPVAQSAGEGSWVFKIGDGATPVEFLPVLAGPGAFALIEEAAQEVADATLAVTAGAALAEESRIGAVAARSGAEGARADAVLAASQAAADAAEAAGSASTATAARQGAQEAEAGALAHLNSLDLQAHEASLSAAAALASQAAAASSQASASTSAATATQAATDADADRVAAQTARTGAETARTGAETARTGAETARDVALAGQYLGALVGVATDFNTFTTPGVYRWQTAIHNASPNNPGLAAGVLEVFNIIGGVVVQRYTQSGGRGVSIRSYSTSGGWISWKFMPTQRVETLAGSPGSNLFLWDEVGARETAVQPIGMSFSSGSLDALILPGSYFNTTTTAATLANNWPIAGVLAQVEVSQVSTSAPALGGNLIQRVTPYGGAQLLRGTYVRSRVSGTWGTWRFVPVQRVDQTAGRAIYTWDDLNNREQLVYGDTGWRDVSADLINGWTGSVYLRRVGYTVELVGRLLNSTAATSSGFLNLASAFRPVNSIPLLARPASNTATPIYGSISAAGAVGLVTGAAFQQESVSQVYTTVGAWPTTLPGLAVGGIQNI